MLGTSCITSSTLSPLGCGPCPSSVPVATMQVPRTLELLRIPPVLPSSLEGLGHPRFFLGTATETFRQADSSKELRSWLLAACCEWSPLFPRTINLIRLKGELMCVCVAWVLHTLVVGSPKRRPGGAELWLTLTSLPPAGPTNPPSGAAFQRRVSGQRLEHWSLALLNGKRLSPGERQPAASRASGPTGSHSSLSEHREHLAVEESSVRATHHPEGGAGLAVCSSCVISGRGSPSLCLSSSVNSFETHRILGITGGKKTKEEQNEVCNSTQGLGSPVSIISFWGGGRHGVPMCRVCVLGPAKLPDGTGSHLTIHFSEVHFPKALLFL